MKIKNKNWKLKILVFGLVFAWVFADQSGFFAPFWGRRLELLSVPPAYAASDIVAKSRIGDVFRAPLKSIDESYQYYDEVANPKAIYAIELDTSTDASTDEVRTGSITTWYFRTDGGAWQPLTTNSAPVKFTDIAGGFTYDDNYVLDSGAAFTDGCLTYERALRYHEVEDDPGVEIGVKVSGGECSETQAAIDVGGVTVDGTDLEFKVDQGVYNFFKDPPDGPNWTQEFIGKAHIYFDGPRVKAINPSSANNDAPATISSVTGHGFISGSAVKLVKGASQIACTGFTFTDFFTLSNGVCDITGAAAGAWDVVVTNPNGKSHTLTGGFTVVSADTTIEPTTPNYWAWNDVIGWIDFCNPDQFGICQPIVDTAPPAMTRYASSSVGYVALNCDNADIGLSCTGNPQNDFKVNIEDTGSVSKLSGWAWNDVIGWISFCGSDSSGSIWNAVSGKWDCPPSGGSSFYQVEINNGTREFHGWAWNDVVGWISFNCLDLVGGSCTPAYRVMRRGTPQPQEGILTSSIFDTTGDGAMINSILWKAAPGNNVLGINVQIASSDNSGGPWNFYNPETGDSSYAYAVADTPVVVKDFTRHANKRYFRYRVQLVEVAGQSPLVDDIIINWSP